MLVVSRETTSKKQGPKRGLVGPPARPYNAPSMKVLAIVARGLQAGALGCYGNRWAQAPALDALAATGALFDQHFADCADAEGARRAWRTGCYDLPQPGQPPLSFQPPDLLRALANRAFTHLIVDASRPAPAQFEEGWDVVERMGPDEGPALEATLEAALAALEELAERDDWLLWVDLGTALPPWDVPEEFLAIPEPEAEEEDEEEEALEAEDEAAGEEGALNEGDEEEAPIVPLTDVAEGPLAPEDDARYLQIQAGYGAAVSYLDAGIGQLLEALEEQEDVVVMFTADRGLALGEHGAVGGAGAGPHEEVIHLPLLVRLPGVEPGLRLAFPTQNVDLAPTLAELFGGALAGAHGHSLLPLLRGEGAWPRAYACAGLQVGDDVEWALRAPEWALLLPVQKSLEDQRGPRLYVKPDDRWEVNDVAQHHLERVEQLEKVLRGFASATARPGPVQAPGLAGEASPPV